MTARVVHVTHLTPPGSDNASRAYYDNKHQLTPSSMIHVTTSMVDVTNPTPGSESSPTCEGLGLRARLARGGGGGRGRGRVRGDLRARSLDVAVQLDPFESKLCETRFSLHRFNG
jgi:hypothetical protein